MKPNILDPKFRYTSAAATNVAETFKRERKRIAEQLRRAADEKEKVTDLDLRRQALLRR